MAGAGAPAFFLDYTVSSPPCLDSCLMPRPLLGGAVASQAPATTVLLPHAVRNLCALCGFSRSWSD